MRLIVNIRPWIGRKFGCFKKYLHRMSKTAFPYSLYEEGGVIHDVEYTVFKCARWQSYRHILALIIRTTTTANIVGVTIASREN